LQSELSKEFSWKDWNKIFLGKFVKGTRRGDQEEPMAKAVRELQQASGKMVCSVEWLEDRGLLWFRGKIYVPQNTYLQRRVVSLCYDTKVAGHPGCWKTLELVSRNYWWPQMSRYIGQYVSTYDLCIRTKLIRQALVGELHPLWIPDLRWDMLSVDFVMKFPLSSRYDTVMTVVDSVSKQAYFIPTHTMVTVEGVARLFLHQVWKLHGLPKCIISDCGPVTNFIRPYLHQFFDNSHGLNGYGKPLRRPFDRYQSHLKEISIGRDIRQINW